MASPTGQPGPRGNIGLCINMQGDARLRHSDPKIKPGSLVKIGNVPPVGGFGASSLALALALPLWYSLPTPSAHLLTRSGKQIREWYYVLNLTAQESIPCGLMSPEREEVGSGHHRNLLGSLFSHGGKEE